VKAFRRNDDEPQADHKKGTLFKSLFSLLEGMYPQAIISLFE
jgi:hypothetical protein